MEFRLSDALDILRRTPPTVDALLRGSAPAWHDAREGEQTWCAREVVGHLIHGEETDWIPRAIIIREAGESRPFEPFDRLAQKSRFATWSVDALLDRFIELRGANLATLAGWNLTPEELELVGRHPDFGRVTLGQLLATWCVHDLTHIAQIVRVMARQYDEAVGPWRTYLSLLEWKREG